MSENFKIRLKSSSSETADTDDDGDDDDDDDDDDEDDDEDEGEEEEEEEEDEDEGGESKTDCASVKSQIKSAIKAFNESNDFSEKRRLHDLVVRLKNSYGDICDATGIQEILDYRPSGDNDHITSDIVDSGTGGPDTPLPPPNRRVVEDGGNDVVQETGDDNDNDNGDDNDGDNGDDNDNNDGDDNDNDNGDDNDGDNGDDNDNDNGDDNDGDNGGKEKKTLRNNKCLV